MRVLCYSRAVSIATVLASKTPVGHIDSTLWVGGPPARGSAAGIVLCAFELDDLLIILVANL